MSKGIHLKNRKFHGYCFCYLGPILKGDSSPFNLQLKHFSICDTPL